MRLSTHCNLHFFTGVIGGFAVVWQLVYTLTNGAAFAADPKTSAPVFDGQRDSFVGWYMLFTGYVAWKATDAYTIADGSEEKPAPPLRVPGRHATRIAVYHIRRSVLSSFQHCNASHAP